MKKTAKIRFLMGLKLNICIQYCTYLHYRIAKQNHSFYNVITNNKQKSDFKMTKGCLKTLLKYVSNVYDLGKKINSLRDKRKNTSIPTKAVAISLIIGFMLSIRSFNKLDDYLENNDFRKIIPKRMKLPRIGTVRGSLKTFEIDGLIRVHDEIVKKSKENKLYRNGTIDGLKVVALDGVELFESKKKNCPNCLTRIINKVPHYIMVQYQLCQWEQMYYTL